VHCYVEDLNGGENSFNRQLSKRYFDGWRLSRENWLDDLNLKIHHFVLEVVNLFWQVIIFLEQVKIFSRILRYVTPVNNSNFTQYCNFEQWPLLYLFNDITGELEKLLNDPGVVDLRSFEDL